MIASATEWENFFALRTAANAQPEFRHLANLMLGAYVASTPVDLDDGDWHLPLTYPEDWRDLWNDMRIAALALVNPVEYIIRVSAGRCARVSYQRHLERDIIADIQRHDRLVSDGHVSPLEHQAQALATLERSGNFIGFRQYRKMLSNEVRSFDYDSVTRD